MLDDRWSLDGDHRSVGLESLWDKGVAAMAQHALGVVMRVCGRLDMKVMEHRVRLPAAKELDGVLIHASAEEGSGATRAERPSQDEGRVNAGGLLEEAGGVSEGVADVGGLGVDPLRRGGVVVFMNFLVRCHAGLFETQGDATECFCQAEHWVVCGLVADARSPLTAFFWSENSKLACMSRTRSVSSF